MREGEGYKKNKLEEKKEEGENKGRKGGVEGREVKQMG